MKRYPIQEGYMPYLGYQTYYRIVGEPSNKPALLLLHGGPGSTHNYFEVLDRIAETGRQVISYDQIGCGNSYLDGHPELWTQKTWINELIALREHLHLDQIHLLGQSWGAMQAIAYIIDCQPQGIKSVILSSGHASSSLWASEQHRLIGEIKQPNLICSGTRDICTPVVAASLYEGIPNSRWEVFKGARHTCFVEQTDKYCDILKPWLEENDNN